MIHRSLRERSVLTAIIAGVAIIAVLAYVGYFLFGSSPTAGKDAQAFFTVDDGTTYFADDALKLPPFDHAGKLAVRAYVFTDTPAGDRRWVQYLQKFSDDEQKQLKGKNDTSNFLFGLVKKPGDKDWIVATQVAASPITLPKSPHGVPLTDIRQVFP